MAEPIEKNQPAESQTEEEKQSALPEQLEQVSLDEPIKEPIQIKPEEPENQKFIEDDLPRAQKLKSEGNEYFKYTKYLKAIDCYQEALRYASPTQTKLRSILYSNIAVCLTKDNDYKDAIDYCKKSIANDPTYLKAHTNLAIAYEKTDNPQEALVQYKKLQELNPKDLTILVKIKELQKAVNELNQKRKAEVMDGLKSIGNSILGFFNLSLDNFKLNPTENGGYNVSFKN